ncbi:exodeoxyribonuclease VII small subunit [Synechococcus sp. TAK9802]|uniref:exodeoxyribonuclease VII small subunit n=1 Tax=Synechococcus sp. TAK9802 TaxID=1442558 RepID=UPI00164413E0|nr:exodeoxyribonuclease VII small subunit [Synechococcus sp. TAK9802]QNI62617.1 exodeoxyribonuclease VII/ small subunit [Synechococcus sp. TAK9802]
MSKRQAKKEQRDRIETWRKDAETLSYEEAMQALDLLLAELQNDSVPLADLQQKVLHGEVYLNRCQSLLDSVEQSIVEFDPITLKATTDA